MPISYHCPHCQTPMVVLEKYAGQTGPCAVCAKPITIPLPRQRDGLDRGGESITSDAARDGNRDGAESRPERAGLSPMVIFSILMGTGAASVLLVVLSLLVVRFGMPALQAMRVDSMNRASQANLKKIALALNQYQTEHGTYPPAYLVDDQGTPTHSWRVLILPQLGYVDLYQRFDLNSPWDSPQNSTLAYEMPSEYCSFGEPRFSKTETRFVVVTGGGTMFPAQQSVSAQAVKDDPQTILTVVEMNGPPVQWTTPDREPKRGSVVMTVSNDPENALTLGPTMTGNVAVLSGEAYQLPEYISTPLLDDMLSHSGGEFVWPQLELILNDS
ncbi:MAG: DUF1559 domain-containing protein [Pirellulaceae bacterium]